MTVCMLTAEQSSTSSSGKGAHARLCVCVSHDAKSFPALHLIPCTHPTVCTKQETLGHSSSSESDKPAWSVNFSNTLLLCSSYSSANTQHLAGRDCAPNRALLGTVKSCFGSSELEKCGAKTSNLNHYLMGTKSLCTTKKKK